MWSSQRPAYLWLRSSGAVLHIQHQKYRTPRTQAHRKGKHTTSGSGAPVLQTKCTPQAAQSSPERLWSGRQPPSTPPVPRHGGVLAAPLGALAMRLLLQLRRRGQLHWSQQERLLLRELQRLMQQRLLLDWESLQPHQQVLQLTDGGDTSPGCTPRQCPPRTPVQTATAAPRSAHHKCAKLQYMPGDQPNKLAASWGRPLTPVLTAYLTATNFISSGGMYSFTCRPNRSSRVIRSQLIPTRKSRHLRSWKCFPKAHEKAKFTWPVWVPFSC